MQKTSANMPAFAHITTLVFDLGGVIINLDKDACVRAFMELGIPVAALIPDNYNSYGLALKLENGEITPDEFRQSVRQMTDRPVSDRQIDDAINAFLLDIPRERLTLLRELRRHYRVVMLSNTNVIHMDCCKSRQFRTLGGTVEDYFDRLYLSYEMHLSKPDPRIFLQLLREEQVSAGQCFYLDDSPRNIQAADALGFHTRLVTPGEDLRRLFAGI